MRRFFGTDGIRGLANTPPMDAETVLRAGMAAGAYFTRGKHRHRVVIGKDTRLSGYMVEPALTAGFISMGMDVVLLGPVPTPAVGMITRSLRADLGVMISASHNPFHDNGIKFFTPDGLKLSDIVEAELESLMASDMTRFRAAPDALGRAKRLDDAPGRYVEYVKQTFPKHLTLDGLRVVVDCAHGAAYKMAPSVLWELGAEVIAIGVEPDGFNINRDCGSTHPQKLIEKVREHRADIGLALDGDADRLIVVDEKGTMVDGDQIMGAIAAYWHERGRLKGGGMVATVMSNLGLEQFLTEQGLTLARTQVGDRYVMQKMREGGYNLGGEQSGHIIFNDFTTTGDGIVAALQVLALLVEKRTKASKVLKVFELYPQLLKNVKYNAKEADPLGKKSVQKAIAEVEKSLAGSGRVVIRKSGTEPVIRVMAEAKDKKAVTHAVDAIIQAIETA